MVKKVKAVVPVKRPKLGNSTTASKGKIAKVIVKTLQVKKFKTKTASQSEPTKKSKSAKKMISPPASPSLAVPIAKDPPAFVPTVVNGIASKPQTKSGDERLINRLHDRLCETEKKLAIILSYIRNQYGEDHSIIQLVKASVGQPLDEELVCNVGRVSGPRSRPIFCPPPDSIEYPRHIWVPRDSIPSSEYENAFAPIPKTAKSKRTAKTKSKVVSTMTRLDPISPPPVEDTPRPLRPLELLEAELDNISYRGGPTGEGGVSASTLIYSDSEDEEALLHEQPEFETIRSIVAAASGDAPFYQGEDEGPPFQILSTTSLASDPTKIATGGGEYYTCIECNKRFISVRQLASHSLMHNKNESGSKTKNGLTSPAKTKIKAAPKPKKEKRVQKKKNQPQSNQRKQHRPMPGTLSGRAPSTLKRSTSKNAIVSKVSMVAKKRTAAVPSAPVVCELCNKLCSSRNSYNYHKIIQHNAKKTIFICSICQKCCPSAAALAEHRSIVHGTEAEAKQGSSSGGGNCKSNKFTCRHCSKVFLSVERLALHLKTHWPDTQMQYKCEDCGHTFKNGEALASHAKIVHGKMIGDKDAASAEDTDRTTAAAVDVDDDGSSF